MTTPAGNTPMDSMGDSVHSVRRLQSTATADDGGATDPVRGTSPVDALTQQFPSMMMLLQGLRRCWLMALVLAVVVAGTLGAGTWFLLPLPKAKSRAMVYIPSSNPYLVFADREGDHNFLDFKKTQASLVKSRLVLVVALRDPKISSLPLVRAQPDPVEWLERDLLVDFSDAPEILSVTLSGDDSQANAIVDAVVKAYIGEIVEKDQKQRSDRLKQLEILKDDYRGRLASRRLELRAVATAIGATDKSNIALQQKIALDQLASAQKDLTQGTSEIRSIEVELNETLRKAKEKAMNEEPVPEALLRAQIDKDPLVLQHLKKQSDLQAEIDTIKERNPSRWQEITVLRSRELAEVSKTLEARRAKIRDTAIAQVREQMLNTYRHQLVYKEGRLEFLKKLKEQLEVDVKRLDQESRKLTTGAFDLESAQDAVAETADMLKKIKAEAATMEVETKAPARIKVLEDAVSSRPNKIKLQLIATASVTVLSFAAVLLGLGWREHRVLRINSANQVTGTLGVPVMGTLPMVGKRTRSAFGFSGPSSEEQESFLMESVDLIRTVLLHTAGRESIRTLMVTSASVGEGKTSLSAQLATSLARSGRKTLLIDGDLRDSSLDRIFGLEQPTGLCEVLRGEAALAEVVQSTVIHGLSVIAGGHCDEVALGALARGSMVGIFAQLREQYDFVLVDSAPVLAVSDSLQIALGVDAVVLSILRDVSRLGPVYSAYERLAGLGIRVLGAVLAGVSSPEYYGRKYRSLGRDDAAVAVQEKRDEEPRDEEVS